MRSSWLLIEMDSAALALSIVFGTAILDLVSPSRVGRIRFPDELAFVPLFLLAFGLHGMYRRRPVLPSFTGDMMATGRALATGVLFSLALDAAVVGGFRHHHLTLTEAVMFAIAALLLVPLLRAMGRHMNPSRGGSSGLERVLIVGTGDVAKSVAARLSCSCVQVVGMVDDEPAPGCAVMGTLADLPRLCEAHQVSHVVVAFSRTPSHEVVDLLYSMVGDREICIVPRLFEMLTWQSTVDEIHGIPVVHVVPARLSATARVIKRSFDLVVSLLLLVILAPLLIAVAIAIRVTSKGPVLFRQRRWGRNSKVFQIFKFRTMIADAQQRQDELSALNEVDGPVFKIRADPRLTSIGAFLRRSSLDELPQLLNVVLGQMSLVGPRPLPVAQSQQIGDGRAKHRFEVLPGMTGLWQVSGRSELAWEDLQHLDSIYVASWSLRWDLRILLETPASVLRGRGAY